MILYTLQENVNKTVSTMALNDPASRYSHLCIVPSHTVPGLLCDLQHTGEAMVCHFQGHVVKHTAASI